MKSIQHFTMSDGTVVAFIDKKERICSDKCQPRDIQVIEGEDCRKVREEICIDIRIGQGQPVIGAARGLLHE